MTYSRTLLEEKKASVSKPFGKCGPKIGFIGKIAYNTLKNRDCLLYLYIQTSKSISLSKTTSAHSITIELTANSSAKLGRISPFPTSNMKS
jgi:hypothetical protein